MTLLWPFTYGFQVSFPYSISVFFVTLILLRKTPFLRGIIAATAWAYAVHVIIGGSVLAYYIKDGIGPGAVLPTGREAVISMIGPVFFCTILSIPLWALGIIAIRLGRGLPDKKPYDI